MLQVPGNSVARIWTPRGGLLHGSRSGRADYDVVDEFASTVRYVERGAAGLGWNFTVGDDELAVHIDPLYYGWNARAASPQYVAWEFAQATEGGAITDGQVRAFVWSLRNHVLAVWPGFPLDFPTHAELDTWGYTGQYDGKTDVFPYGDPRADELRWRIFARLGG